MPLCQMRTDRQRDCSKTIKPELHELQTRVPVEKQKELHFLIPILNSEHISHFPFGYFHSSFEQDFVCVVNYNKFDLS